MPDGFRGLSLTPPDFWAPLSLADAASREHPERADQTRVELIGRLRPGVSASAVPAVLSRWAAERSGATDPAGRQPRVWLWPRQGTLSVADLSANLMFAPLFFAFGLVLLIGCANVTNLLLARGVARQREIGVRLSLGASRRRLLRQLLTESLLLALLAAAGALVAARLFLESALAAAVATIPAEFGPVVSVLNLATPEADWRICAFVVAGAIAATALFGIAPALQATRLDVVRAMRGDVTTDGSPRRARHMLIALQAGASALLLICAVIFLRGGIMAATQPAGVRIGDTLRVSIETEPRRAAILQTLRTHPSVAMVAAASRQTHMVLETASRTRVSVEQTGVSPDYFRVLGLNLVGGRGFAAAERTADAGVAVVSQSLAQQLWPAGDAVGQVVRLEPPAPAAGDQSQDRRLSNQRPPAPVRAVTVVGIVSEPGRSSGMSFRGVYVPAAAETPATWLYVRVRGNVDRVRLELAEQIPGLDPVFGVISLGNGMQTALLKIGFGVAVLLGGLALALTVSGLFSVLSYVVEQQAKEIGVRMALGAAARTVIALVLSQSLRPVAIGLTVGGGLALAVAIVLRATPAAAAIAGVVDVLDPVAYAASALVVIVACLTAAAVPTIRAARIDPIITLRRD